MITELVSRTQFYCADRVSRSCPCSRAKRRNPVPAGDGGSEPSELGIVISWQAYIIPKKNDKIADTDAAGSSAVPWTDGWMVYAR